MADFRLAVVQSPAELNGADARLDWMEAILPDIAQDGTDLVLFPELFACGYNIGDEIEIRAEPLDGRVASRVSRLAKSHGLAICYGFAERSGDLIYNAAACLGPDASMIGHHRKLVIPPGFERRCFAAGEDCEVFTYHGLKFATLICYDAEFPETVRHVAGLGAELVLVPTALGANWSWVSKTMIPTRAYENGVYLAYANYSGSERGMSFLGQSVIAAPDGIEETRAGSGPEILYADLSTARIKAAQARLPYLKDRTTLKLS